ncbi:phosphonoacetaldehyde reductase [Thalassospiraceae bacterium LMO-JJ14]|nr:phosphonoacetaldehyde reductase [Thalassospiraceae bacterium LMO-JJ14]
MRPFVTPTVIHQGHVAEIIPSLIRERSWALVTSQGWLDRSSLQPFLNAQGAPKAVISDVHENPKLSEVRASYEKFPDVDYVVAIGGGSVMDAAKGVVALKGLNGDMDAFWAHLRDGAPLPDDLEATPIIAVPTTSGTGSEVTRWGTIWGDDLIKYSVNHPALYPKYAVLDPALCVSMPAHLTVASGLDALSHAMEAIWNNNATSITDALAQAAIRGIYRTLPVSLADPLSIDARRETQTFATLAGMAMSVTQTAACHSISYPFTAVHGVPHGLACSFTLPEMAAFNGATGPDRTALIADALDCPPDALTSCLYDWFKTLDVGRMISAYVQPDSVDSFGDNLITRARAANNIREIDSDIARDIARKSLKNLIP